MTALLETNPPELSFAEAQAMTSLLGWHYSTGPGGEHTVTSDSSAHEGCVTITAESGCSFPLAHELVREIGAPAGLTSHHASRTYVPLADPAAGFLARHAQKV